MEQIEPILLTINIVSLILMIITMRAKDWTFLKDLHINSAWVVISSYLLLTVLYYIKQDYIYGCVWAFCFSIHCIMLPKVYGARYKMLK